MVEFYALHDDLVIFYSQQLHFVLALKLMKILRISSFFLSLGFGWRRTWLEEAWHTRCCHACQKFYPTTAWATSTLHVPWLPLILPWFSRKPTHHSHSVIMLFNACKSSIMPQICAQTFGICLQGSTHKQVL